MTALVTSVVVEQSPGSEVAGGLPPRRRGQKQDQSPATEQRLGCVHRQVNAPSVSFAFCVRFAEGHNGTASVAEKVGGGTLATAPLTKDRDAPENLDACFHSDAPLTAHFRTVSNVKA
jgi:hypothetical protein